ncbi:hypothetical protein ACEQ8H_007500 [Pleosporales sp. CAS-2024a]
MFSLLSLFAYAGLVSAATVTYNFNIGWVTAAPDGYSLPVIGINNKWPIPIIEANLGDTITVNACTGVYDGATGVTNCPIQPGDCYTYSFQANPAGTHWYHSHDKGQYPDGLRGQMIIHDRNWESSLGVAGQIYLTMSDWYHRQMPGIISDYMSPSNTLGDFPSPDTILVNDTCNAPQFNFAAGNKYLIRISNIGGLACGQFHIQGYSLSVVEMDGAQINPVNADTITLCAGQTYGVVVQGQSNPQGGANYIVKMTTDMLTEGIPSDSARTVIGNLVYSLVSGILGLINNIINTLTSSWNPSSTFDDLSATPLDGQPLFGPVDNSIQLATNQTYFPNIGTRISMGSQPWVYPKVPSLFTALTTGSAALDPSTYGPGVDPYVLKSGQIVQINYENPNAYPHPIHLHGHQFQMVARGSGSWNGDESSLPSKPPRRDVWVVPANGYIVIRFQANNPGVWFFHCHIDLHLVGGMAATMVEAPDILQGKVQIPPSAMSNCQKGNQAYSGNCAGSSGAISASDASTKCNNVYNSANNLQGGALAFASEQVDGIHQHRILEEACPSDSILVDGMCQVTSLDASNTFASTMTYPSNLTQMSQTLEESRRAAQEAKDFPWTFWPECFSDEKSEEVYCVFSQQDFASGRGIFMLTTKARAYAMLDKAAFRNPKVLGDINQYDKPPFVVGEFAGKGRGLIANKTLHRGDRIFASTPIVLSDSTSYELSNSERLALLHRGVETLPGESQKRFWELMGHFDGDAVNDRIETNVFDVTIDGISQSALFPEIAMLNHDCRPNAAYFFDDDLLTHFVHATRDIVPGEEITITYIDNEKDRKTRMARLKKSWGFDCDCAACTASAAVAAESDSRLFQISDVAAVLDDWTAASRATPEAAELLVALYVQERLDASLATAYKYAAETYSSFGKKWDAIRYARLSVQMSQLDKGFRDRDTKEMKKMAEKPEMTWSWNKRVGLLQGCGCKH